jgi:heme A synthase
VPSLVEVTGALETLPPGYRCRFVTEIHHYFAFVIPTGWLVIAAWAAATLVRNRPPAPLFWSLLAVMQVALGIQALIGIILFLMGYRPNSNGPSWLHYVYGLIFPVVVLTFAHRYAQRDRFKDIPWLVFGVAAFLIGFATIRAIQTGLGID